MKKSLLVAALAIGFAGVAHAETSVTLYGVIDGGIGYERVKGTFNGQNVNDKRTGLIDGINQGNRWGLKGTEDLGNGLQAVFVLENGFDLGTGRARYDDRMFGRQATIGLKSEAWGQLDFGRQTNIASKYLAPVVSPFGVDFGQAKAGTTFGAADSIRYDNMVMYQTPNYAGFQFGVGYSFNNDGNQQFKSSGGDEPNTRAWTTGLRYANGPLAAAVTYDQLKTADQVGFAPLDQTGVSVKAWNLGASYDFEIVKVYAGFGQARNGWLTGVGYGSGVAEAENGDGYFANNGMKVNSYTVGLSAPVGANGQVMASWGMADPKNNGSLTGELHKQHAYSLGYTYALSKRTNLYAIGSYVDHALFQDDLKSTLVGVGLRHQF